MMKMREVRLIVNKLTRLKTTTTVEVVRGRGGYAYITPSCEISRPVPVVYPLFRGAIVNAVSVGNGFIVGAYQDEDKHAVCAYGVNRTLQLGELSSKNQMFDKKLWFVVDPVVKLKSGRAHTLGLSECGLLCGWGSNNMGQLGCSTGKSSFPFAYLNHTDVRDIATGLDNSFLLKSNGCVLSCGWAADGQTGCGSTQMLESFTEVNIPNPVVKISSSADSTLVICEDGRVYGWGNNEYHQISPSPEMSLVTPTEIDLPEPMTDVAAGGSFSLFLSTSGRLYSCGYGPGTGLQADNCLHLPTLVPCSHGLVTITASLDHAAGVTEGGGVVRWGRGLHHKLITETDADIITPELLKGLKPRVREVVCAPNKTCIITDQPIKGVDRLGMIEGHEDDEA